MICADRWKFGTAGRCRRAHSWYLCRIPKAPLKPSAWGGWFPAARSGWIAERLRDRPVLLTFNGKSFDWPFLLDQAAVSRMALPDLRNHCDLLHAARRRYRDRLPDCRLRTLELHVCGRHRVGDIAGADHRFVQTGDARLLREIVHHNFLDLITLAELLTVLTVPSAWGGGRPSEPRP